MEWSLMHVKLAPSKLFRALQVEAVARGCEDISSCTCIQCVYDRTLIFEQNVPNFGVKATTQFWRWNAQVNDNDANSSKLFAMLQRVQTVIRGCYIIAYRASSLVIQGIVDSTNDIATIKAQDTLNTWAHSFEMVERDAFDGLIFTCRQGIFTKYAWHNELDNNVDIDSFPNDGVLSVNVARVGDTPVDSTGIPIKAGQTLKVNVIEIGDSPQVGNVIRTDLKQINSTTFTGSTIPIDISSTKGIPLVNQQIPISLDRVVNVPIVGTSGFVPINIMQIKSNNLPSLGTLPINIQQVKDQDLAGPEIPTDIQKTRGVPLTDRNLPIDIEQTSGVNLTNNKVPVSGDSGPTSMDVNIIKVGGANLPVSDNGPVLPSQMFIRSGAGIKPIGGVTNADNTNSSMHTVANGIDSNNKPKAPFVFGDAGLAIPTGYPSHTPILYDTTAIGNKFLPQRGYVNVGDATTASVVEAVISTNNNAVPVLGEPSKVDSNRYIVGTGEFLYDDVTLNNGGWRRRQGMRNATYLNGNLESATEVLKAMPIRDATANGTPNTSIGFAYPVVGQKVEAATNSATETRWGVSIATAPHYFATTAAGLHTASRPGDVQGNPNSTLRFVPRVDDPLIPLKKSEERGDRSRQSTLDEFGFLPDDKGEGVETSFVQEVE
jgi:hypothetical protein